MPSGPRIARPEDVGDKVTDGEHPTPKRTTEGIKLLSARNIRDGFLDFRMCLEHYLTTPFMAATMSATR